MQYLYLIKCQQFYKIGIANDVESRLAQLSTGNPFPLEVKAVYGFENSAPVEASIHQRFSKERRRGEWFELDDSGELNFNHICRVLGGQFVATDNQSLPTNDEIEEAEEIQEISLPVEGGKWDYGAMFSEGWRMEKNGAGLKTGRYWLWRKGCDSDRKSLYGGLVSELPLPLEEMREKYDKKGNGNGK